MLHHGIIQESTGHEFNSPCSLVMKRNGTKRLVIDLRELNSIIKPKPVQLPKTDEVIDSVTVSIAQSS